MLLSIVITQVLSSLLNMEKIVKDTVLEHQRLFIEEKEAENIGSKEKKLIERKHELFLKNLVDEF